MIGAPAATAAGYAYVVYGGLTLPSTLDLTGLTATQGMRIPGLVSNTAFGWAAAVGDVNGDGIADSSSRRRARARRRRTRARVS